jgi:hypothetical protein
MASRRPPVVARRGRSMKFPANGITGATKCTGTHKLSFKRAQRCDGPGNYTLVVEAAREVGGRELLRLPFSLAAKGGAGGRAAGTTELGAVSLAVKLN